MAETKSATTTGSTQIAVTQRAGAQQISAGLASAIDLVVPHLEQVGKLQPGGDVFAGTGRDLAEVIAVATQIVARLASMRSAEESANSSKVMSVVVAVVLVVVAVVIAAFTFGAGAALVALAVIAAATIIGGAVAAATAASTFGAIISAALATLIAGGASALTEVQAAIQRYSPERGVDPNGARSRLLRAILQALRRIDALTPQMDTVTGPCLGDPSAVYATLQNAYDTLQKLLSALRRTQSGADAYPVMSGLEALVAALKKAMESLRPLSSPAK